MTGGTGREIRVEITRTSRGRTDDDVRLGLQRVTVKVEQQGDRATVAVEYPREERRNGYSWYGSAPAQLLNSDYPAWEQRITQANTTTP